MTLTALRILLATLLISNTFIVSGCALFQGATPMPETMDPKEKVYKATFDEIWLATQKAMAIYPMRVNNMDLRILETDIIKSDEYWSPPHGNNMRSGDEYKLVVRIIEGNLSQKTAHKVSVSKIKYSQKDFFSQKSRAPSTGLEEEALLYRIKRELIIERALVKAQRQEE